MNNIKEATVVKHTGSHYLLSKLPSWNVFPAVIRGRLRLKGFNSTNPIAVGDIVTYDEKDGEMAVISRIHSRKNYIIRKSTNLSRQSHVIASNLDAVYLIITIDFPETKPAFVDRFLVTCEAYKIPVKILLNKTDLYDDSHQEKVKRFKEIYTTIGYEVIDISAKRGDNIDWLRLDIKDKIVLFSGSSGVGKSSLINALDPELSARIGKISRFHNQGRHTTTFYEMHPVATGGFVIDTPGIRGFGLVDFKSEEISLYFPEMFALADNCKFMPCTHTHEPGCAIKEALENGDIFEERYYSYLGMLDEEGKYR